MQKGIDYIGVSVGAIIINDKGQVLLTKRSQKTRNEQGKWEAPGGAVKFGEKREEAVKREIQEELGVDIEIIRVIHTSDEILSEQKQHWVPTSYLVKIKDNQEPKIMEPEKCDEIKWFSLNELPPNLSYITTLDLQAYKQQIS